MKSLWIAESPIEITRQKDARDCVEEETVLAMTALYWETSWALETPHGILRVANQRSNWLFCGISFVPPAKAFG